MPKHMRPWLRAIEGPGSGGSAGSGSGAGSGTGAAGDAGSGDTGGDQGSGDRGSGDGDKGGDGAGDGDKAGDSGDDGEQKPADKPGEKQSEPTPKPNEAGEKADSGDSDQVAALKAELAAMKETLAPLVEANEKAAEEKRTELTTDVAKKAGLPEGMASRLQGDTREQLEADAKNLAQALGFRVVDPTQGQGRTGAGSARSLTSAIQAKIAAAGLK